MRTITKYQAGTYVVLGLGTALLLMSFLLTNWINFQPVNSPVALEKSVTLDRTFLPNFSANYVIEIEVERKLPFSEINCMLGLGNAVATDCRATDSRIELNWEVRYSDSGAIVAQGSSDEESGGAWSDKISRIIGRFAAEKGNSYDLMITSNALKPIPTLLKPHVSVRLDPLVAKNFHVTSNALLWLGLVFLVIGLVARGGGRRPILGS